MITDCIEYFCECCDKKIKGEQTIMKYIVFVYNDAIDEFQVNGMCLPCYKNEIDEEERNEIQEELNTIKVVYQEKIGDDEITFHLL